MVLWLNRKLSLFFWEATVLVFHGCFNKYHKLGGLNNTNLFSYSLEVRSLKWAKFRASAGLLKLPLEFLEKNPFSCLFQLEITCFPWLLAISPSSKQSHQCWTHSPSSCSYLSSAFLHFKDCLWYTEFTLMIYHIRIFKDFISFQERGREAEREGEKHQCVVVPCMPQIRYLAHNPGMCPDWELNQRPFGLQATTQSTETYQQGWCAIF